MNQVDGFQKQGVKKKIKASLWAFIVNLHVALQIVANNPINADDLFAMIHQSRKNSLIYSLSVY